MREMYMHVCVYFMRVHEIVCVCVFERVRVWVLANFFPPLHRLHCITIKRSKVFLVSHFSLFLPFYLLVLSILFMAILFPPFFSIYCSVSNNFFLNLLLQSVSQIWVS